MSRSCTGREPSSTLLAELPRLVSKTFAAPSDLDARCRQLAEFADRSAGAGLGPRWLSAAARSLAEVARPWEDHIGPPAEERSYRCLVRSPYLEVWLIHWPCGGRLQLHDHGGASGAFRVISGELQETYIDARCRLAQRQVGVGQGLAFGPRYVHDVANTHEDGATSVHVYAPPADVMFFYRYQGPGQLLQVGSAPFEEPEATLGELEASYGELNSSFEEFEASFGASEAS